MDDGWCTDIRRVRKKAQIQAPAQCCTEHHGAVSSKMTPRTGQHRVADLELLNVLGPARFEDVIVLLPGALPIRQAPPLQDTEPLGTLPHTGIRVTARRAEHGQAVDIAQSTAHSQGWASDSSSLQGHNGTPAGLQSARSEGALFAGWQRAHGASGPGGAPSQGSAGRLQWRLPVWR